ncbi:GPI mannosyltransferase 3 [Tanacetum coccineum]
MRKRTNVVVSAHGDDVSNSKSLEEDRKQGASQFSSWKILLICIVFRMANSLFVQTYFNPDEHWQALEVAHRVTFGYGHLTWEWTKGIRSYLHPMLFAVLYKVLSILHLDTPLFMIKAPRLLQSIFSAFGDLYLFKLSHVLYGGRVAQWALFAQLSNWFMFYCSTRTLSNSLETVHTVITVIACAIRPTSAIIWLYVGLMELFVSRDRLKFVFLEVHCAWTDLLAGPLDVWFVDFSASKLSKVQLFIFGRRLLWNSSVALVLHPGIYCHDLFFPTFHGGWHHPIEKLEAFRTHFVGFSSL